MEKLNIICIDDHREVLAALRKDLTIFEEHCNIEECESADEAAELFNELYDGSKNISLVICDHVMPKKNGIDFLIEVNQDSRFRSIRKIVLTGLATHQDTIIAINKAGINKWIEKPWYTNELQDMIKTLLTEYILEKEIPYEPFADILDKDLLYQDLSKKF